MAISDLRLTAKPSVSPSELSDLNALVAEASWNQVADDWRVFLEHGRLYVAQSTAGRIVASTTTLPYGGRFAWVSMVLVAGEYRRRGLATALLRQAMADLEAGGLRPVLDATPDGRAVYRRLGFVDSWGFHRLIRRERPPARTTTPEDLPFIVRPLSESDWLKVTAYDASVFGAERSVVLARLRRQLPRANLIAERDGSVAGVLLGRDGRLAQHLGPVIADDVAIACALLDHALAALEGPLIMDVADEQLDVRQFLLERGFAPVRPFTRMIYGTPARSDDARRTFAVFGPEFG